MRSTWKVLLYRVTKRGEKPVVFHFKARNDAEDFFDMALLAENVRSAHMFDQQDKFMGMRDGRAS
jgi:hypothetical protein